MSWISGIFFNAPNTEIPRLVDAMNERLAHFKHDGIGTFSANQVGFGNIKLNNTPESKTEDLPFTHTESGLTITADARIDNREWLLNTLDISNQNIPDSQIILAAYSKWGKDCPSKLYGDFAFAIWNEKEKELFCARDQVGIKPFFYTKQGDLFAFASEIKGLKVIPNCSWSVDDSWIAKYISNSCASKTDTIYKQIKKLEPGHWLSISRDQLQIKRYWDLDPERELDPKSEDDYVAEFRELLIKAVDDRTRSAFNIASELSGGIDSSAIASIAWSKLKNSDRKLYTFSNTSSDVNKKKYDQIDEKHWSDQVVAYAEIPNHKDIDADGEGFIKNLQQSVFVFDGPAESNFALMTDLMIAEAAKTGSRTLLSGFGGDDMVTTIYRPYYEDLINQGKYGEAYSVLQQLSKRKKKPALYYFLHSFLRTNGVIKPNTPSSIDEKYAEFHIQSDFRKFIDSKKEPSQPKPVGQIRYRQREKILHPNITERASGCLLRSRAQGVEYRYPLFDVPLMEYYLSAPVTVKTKLDKTRYLYRRAVEGFLPEPVQWRADKRGAAIGYKMPRLMNDREAILSILKSADRNHPIHKYYELDKAIKTFETLNPEGEKEARNNYMSNETLRIAQLIITFDTQF